MRVFQTPVSGQSELQVFDMKTKLMHKNALHTYKSNTSVIFGLNYLYIYFWELDCALTRRVIMSATFYLNLRKQMMP